MVELSRTVLANAIRALSMDAVEKAKSGHPGAPMGMADIAEVLWNDFLRHNPGNPHWPNRDRFILSNGHASMLLYSLLHLTGYNLSLGEIKNFRQLHSKTPGHPERGYTPGVETTTGPLGQGLANGVGMAIAEKVLAQRFNQKQHRIVDHYTYVFLGDGCLMEGISHEACSLAGTLGLNKLICFYDDNSISIDGKVSPWFTDNTPERFKSYNWHVISDVDGHDRDSIVNAIEEARKQTNKASLICCKTIIGFGAPNKKDTAAVHGAPLGEGEIKLARKELNWSYAPFEIPENIYKAWDKKNKGMEWEQEWEEVLHSYEKEYPELAKEYKRITEGKFPSDLKEKFSNFVHKLEQEKKAMATRKASKECLEFFTENLPELMGGSADLSGSNLTFTSLSKHLTKEDANGNYIYYGVREFAMNAIMNGMALHGGIIPYSGTFLTFMEYGRNAVRMAALMKQKVIFVYTHDSIGLGEDGPTHQAVEQLANLRSTPNLSVWRPCDATETAIAWKSAITRKEGPTALVFSRHTVPHLERSKEALENIEKGAYILWENAKDTELVFLSTGSELSITLEAAKVLGEEGEMRVRVVSIPSVDAFEAQEDSYKEAILGRGKRIAVEASSADYWYKFVGLKGKIIGMRSFGESAPQKVLYEHFGFTKENIINVARNLVHGGN